MLDKCDDMPRDIDRQGSAVTMLEKMLADWDSDGAETYCELAVKLLAALIKEQGFGFLDEGHHTDG